MRRLDDLARLWNDTRAGMRRGAWAWPLAAAVAGAMITLIGTSSFGTSPESESGTASSAVESVESNAACEDQTWPYFSNACLQRNETAGGPSTQAQKPNKVRVLNYDPAMAQAAIGATPWAPKDTSAFRQSHGHKQAAPKQAIRDADRSRSATTRSGRRERSATRNRGYDVPGDRDAVSAYGYVPR